MGAPLAGGSIAAARRLAREWAHGVDPAEAPGLLSLCAEINKRFDRPYARFGTFSQPATFDAPRRRAPLTRSLGLGAPRRWRMAAKWERGWDRAPIFGGDAAQRPRLAS